MKRIGQVRSGRSAHARHANSGGTNPTTAEARCCGGAPKADFGQLIAVKKDVCPGLKLACDKASPEHAVMLHLRARYVSKAAILTIPAPLVPVENRSPA